MSLPPDDMPSGYTTNAIPVPPLGSPYPAPGAPKRGLGFAIASVILGALGVGLAIIPILGHLIVGVFLALLGIIFGHIGFGQARKTDSNAGRAVAAIGLALGYLGAGIVLLQVLRDIIVAMHPLRFRHHA